MSAPQARPARRAGEVAVAGGLLALGIAFAIGSWRLPAAPGYSQIGPAVFPALISAGLVVIGAILLFQALTSGFAPVSADQAEEERTAFDLRAFLWVSAGVIAHMVLIAGIGFILGSSLLFACVARAFGSTRPARDLAIGLLLNGIVYAIFTRALTLNLPWGTWLPAIG